MIFIVSSVNILYWISSHFEVNDNYVEQKNIWGKGEGGICQSSESSAGREGRGLKLVNVSIAALQYYSTYYKLRHPTLLLYLTSPTFLVTHSHLLTPTVLRR